MQLTFKIMKQFEQRRLGCAHCIEPLSSCACVCCFVRYSYDVVHVVSRPQKYTTSTSRRRNRPGSRDPWAGAHASGAGLACRRVGAYLHNGTPSNT